jgi:ATP adenylyltransferase
MPEGRLGEDHPAALWAPWRIGFLVGPKSPTCFMCDAWATPQRDAETLVLDRGSHAFVIMNRYPYSGGHLLVAPAAHQGDYAALDDETALEIAQLTRLWLGLLRETMKPDGFNLGWNLGAAAGAGIAEHVHEHLVPRWNGDHNFMSVCADTRIINQSLEEAWKLLHGARARRG